MSIQHKQCPRCRTATPVAALACSHCGFRYPAVAPAASASGPAQHDPIALPAGGPSIDATLRASAPPLAPTKACPWCAETIHADAILCKHCKSALDAADVSLLPARPHALSMPPPTDAPAAGLARQPIPSTNKELEITPEPFPCPSWERVDLRKSQPAEYEPAMTIDACRIYPNASRPSPFVMALLSGFVFTGLGQMIMGQVKKGSLLLIGSILLALMTGGISLFITWPLTVVDAYLIARKLREGQAVGYWEFF